MTIKKKKQTVDPYMTFKQEVVDGLKPFIKSNPLDVDPDKFTKHYQDIAQEALMLNAKIFLEEVEQEQEDDALKRLLTIRDEK